MRTLSIPASNGCTIDVNHAITTWDKKAVLRAVREVWNATPSEDDYDGAGRRAKVVHFDDFNCIVVITRTNRPGATPVVVANPFWRG